MGELIWFRGNELLLQPKREIQVFLETLGAEVKKVDFRDTELWVIAWKDSFFVGQTLREAAREWLGMA